MQYNKSKQHHIITKPGVDRDYVESVLENCYYEKPEAEFTL